MAGKEYLRLREGSIGSFKTSLVIPRASERKMESLVGKALKIKEELWKKHDAKLGVFNLHLRKKYAAKAEKEKINFGAGLLHSFDFEEGPGVAGKKLVILTHPVTFGFLEKEDSEALKKLAADAHSELVKKVTEMPEYRDLMPELILRWSRKKR
jgi:hypothetical protein